MGGGGGGGPHFHPQSVPNSGGSGDRPAPCTCWLMCVASQQRCQLSQEVPTPALSSARQYPQPSTLKLGTQEAAACRGIRGWWSAAQGRTASQEATVGALRHPAHPPGEGPSGQVCKDSVYTQPAGDTGDPEHEAPGEELQGPPRPWGCSSTEDPRKRGSLSQPFAGPRASGTAKVT